MNLRSSALAAARVALALTYISLFSGVEGAGIGLDRAGARCVGRCEIDPQASDVLRYHDAETPNWRDVSALAWMVRRGFIRRSEFPDFVWMSPPCQDLSVAGKRAGLAGARSGLFYDAIRFLRCLIGRGWRGVVLMEQVPGLLSSNGGRDLAAVLRAFQNLGAVDVGWRVLDSQWFGVAQRRARLYFVVDLGGKRAGEVLALAQGLRGDPAPSRQARQGASAHASDRAGDGGGNAQPSTSDLARCCTTGGGNRHDATAETFVPQTVPPIRATGPGSSRIGDSRGQPPVIPCLTTRPYCDREGQEGALVPQIAGTLLSGGHANNPLDECLVPELSHTLRASGFDASEDGTGRGTPIIPIAEVGKRQGKNCLQNGSGLGKDGDPMFTLQASARHAVAAPFDLRNVTSPDNRSRVEFGPPSSTLHSNPPHVALGFPWKNAASAGLPVGEIAPTMGSNRNAEAAVAFQPKYYADRDRQGGKPGEVCPTLTSNAADAGDNAPHVATVDDPKGRLFEALVMKVRRTTPRENERLQGMPDDHTRYGRRTNGKVYEVKDGPRYRFCGNAVTSNTAEWIGRRLIAAWGKGVGVAA